MTDATAAYWLKRAEQFEWCRPQPGDFTGSATAADLAAQDARLAQAAEFCRHRAQLEAESRPEPISDEVREALAEHRANYRFAA